MLPKKRGHAPFEEPLFGAIVLRTRGGPSRSAVRHLVPVCKPVRNMAYLARRTLAQRPMDGKSLNLKNCREEDEDLHGELIMSAWIRIVGRGGGGRRLFDSRHGLSSE